MGVSKNRATPKSSISIGFGTIIFTIHFGGQIPLCLETRKCPYKWVKWDEITLLMKALTRLQTGFWAHLGPALLTPQPG